MHFWINKPVGRSHAIGGYRRYHAATAAVTASSLPASIPLLKTRGHSGRRDGLSINSMNSSNRSTTHWSSTTRAANSSNRINIVRNSGRQLRNEDPERSIRQHHQSNVTIPGQRRRCDGCASPNIYDTSTNHRIVQFSAIGDAELAGNSLLCGVWIMFVLATGFVSIVKFYISNKFFQPDTGDVLIFCGLIIALLISGFFYFSLVRRARNDLRNNNNPPEGAARISCTLSCYQNAPGTSSVSPWTQRPSVLQHLEIPPSPSPPPYHIAIQIPSANFPTIEAPPPSYEKATRSKLPSVIEEV